MHIFLSAGNVQKTQEGAADDWMEGKADMQRHHPYCIASVNSSASTGSSKMANGKGEESGDILMLKAA